MPKENLKMVTGVGLLAAVAVALVYLIHFPIFPAAPFLEYDPADIAILIGALVYGPLPGLALTFVACMIQALTVSAQSGIWGFVMHFFATGSMVMVASLIYTKDRTLKGAVIALSIGALTMTAMMVPLNLIITPLYGVPVQAVAEMLIPVIIPFNLIKAFGNCLLTFLLYKRVGKMLK